VQLLLKVNDILVKSLSQKGDPLESFKVNKVYPGPNSLDGQTYVLADFSYQLNTEAGSVLPKVLNTHSIIMHEYYSELTLWIVRFNRVLFNRPSDSKG